MLSVLILMLLVLMFFSLLVLMLFALLIVYVAVGHVNLLMMRWSLLSSSFSLLIWELLLFFFFYYQLVDMNFIIIILICVLKMRFFGWNPNISVGFLIFFLSKLRQMIIWIFYAEMMLMVLKQFLNPFSCWLLCL